jgi:hypothetical protein
VLYAIIGFVIMFGALVGIGINEPRGTSIKLWCYGYLGISVVFDILVVLALINQGAPLFSALTELLLGLSAGAATGLAIHVAHHILEEGHQETEEGKKTPSKGLFGF